MKESKQFTPTEKKVIELLMQGKSNKAIALALGIEIPTVEFHMGNIFTKLNRSEERRVGKECNR